MYVCVQHILLELQRAFLLRLHDYWKKNQNQFSTTHFFITIISCLLEEQLLVLDQQSKAIFVFQFTLCITNFDSSLRGCFQIFN